MFKLGDKVELTEDYGVWNQGSRGVVSLLRPSYEPKADHLVHVDLDDGRDIPGVFDYRLKLVVPVENDKQAEFVKAKDEVLSKVEDVLTGAVETFLDYLNKQLDKAAPKQ